MRILIIILFISFLYNAKSQDSIVQNGHQEFHFPNGKIASEGTMRNGEPDGYWKTYNKEGILKSEGNRKDFLLDSLWKFYDNKGQLVLSVTYREGKKNGIRTTVLPDKILVDSFENDVKNNWNKILYADGKLKLNVYFKNGLEDGWSYQYAKDGRLVSKTLYTNGFIRKREYFNGYNSRGNRQGLWKEFYENGTTKTAGTYRNGIKDGYFKYYDKNGSLDSIQKYRNGIIEFEPEELAVYEIKTDYYSDGTIKVIGSYLDGKADGVRKEYSPEGKITDGYIMHKGVVVGHGLFDAAGRKQGNWKLFYDNGRILSEGKYVDNKRIGLWKFYYENGKIEQTGAFDKDGFYSGEWQWFYMDGNPRIVELYFEGEREGEFVEYNKDGGVIMQGEYVNSIREGNWVITVNNYIEIGAYLENVKDGIWKYYYTADTLYFEGIFIDGSEDGLHTWYYRNGNKMKTGKYLMSLKEGDWKYYDIEGKLILKVKYKDGIEKEYNAIRIEPELELTDLEE